MEHLNKQQIVLLTLFTTFVASIATGIVTVSLMDQTNVGVTSTINHVIERTVERVVTPAPSTTQTTTLPQSNPRIIDPVADSISSVSKSIVKIKLVRDSGSSEVTGLGLVVTRAGMVLTDKTIISQFGKYVVVMPNGAEYPIQIVQAQPTTDIAFVYVLVPDSDKKSVLFTPIQFPQAISKLGQSIITIAGTENPNVSQGIIKKVRYSQASSTVLYSFETNIPVTATTVGSPIVDLFGNVVGIKTTSMIGEFEGGTSFYPTILLKDVIPTL